MLAEAPFVYVKNRWGGEHLRRSYRGEANPFYGKHHTEETKALIALKAKQRPQETFRKTKIHKERISEALQGKKRTPLTKEHKRAVSLGLKGHRQSEQMKRRVSTTLIGRPKSEETKASMRKPKSFMPPFSQEHRRKIGEANRRRWQWPGFAERVLTKIADSVSAKPNKAEKLLDAILQQHFPNEWEYVGSGKITIAKKKPDFINCNGKKLIIELFGDYWHKGENPQEKISLYKQYGFDTLVIWEHQLSNIKSTVHRIQEFVSE